MAQTWEEALTFGKMVEEYVLLKIQKQYSKAFIRDGRHKQWDIYIPEKKLKIEVKSDVYSNKTGNFVIETSYGDRPSGMTTTTADFWVFFTGAKLIWITPNQIRAAIKESGVELRKFTSGTDIRHKTAFLVPVSFIEGHSTKIESPLTDMPSNFNFRKQ
jgi:hypothetical protein